jgi:hypothetical protein
VNGESEIIDRDIGKGTGGTAMTEHIGQPRKRLARIVVITAIPVLVMAVLNCGGTTVAPCTSGSDPTNGSCESADEAGLDAQAETGTTSDGANGADVASDSSNAGSNDASPVDAPTDQGESAASDPCPGANMPPVFADCAGDCTDSSATAAQCTFLACPSGADPSLNPNIVTVTTFPGIIRTPSGPSSACEAMCAPDAGPGPHDDVTSAVVFAVHLPPATWVQVTVDPPWWVQGLGSPSGISSPDVVCADTNLSYRSSPCIWWDGRYIEVGTNDPNPPARNVTIELVPGGNSSCPR